MLIREPDNPHDPHAISVWIGDGERVGWVPHQAAADIDDTRDRRALVLAEMRVDGTRVGLWLLVSREAVQLSAGALRDEAERRRLEHWVAHLKEESLASLEHEPRLVDPTVAMQLMAEALDHAHEPG
jgi:hypothetical protein